MESKSLITKTPIDKRTNLLQLTQKGEEILNESSSCVKTFRKNLTSKLDNEEINKLIILLEKVTLSVEE